MSDDRAMLETAENAEKIVDAVMQSVDGSRSFVESLYDKVSEMDEKSMSYLQGKIEKELVKVQARQESREKIDQFIKGAKDAIGNMTGDIGAKVSATLAASKEYQETKEALKNATKQRDELITELDKAEDSAKLLGLDPEKVDKCVQLKSQIENAENDMTAYANKISEIETAAKDKIVNAAKEAKDNVKGVVAGVGENVKEAVDIAGNKVAATIAPSKELKAARVDLKKLKNA